MPEGVRFAKVALPVVDTFHVEPDPKISFKFVPVAPESANCSPV